MEREGERANKEEGGGGSTSRNSLQLIIKKELAVVLGKLAWVSGGWQFKVETSEMTAEES